MKIVILGAGGQLGQELLKNLNQEDEIKAYSRIELDLLNHSKVRNIISSERPEIVINAAAYTSVDKAEDNIDEAFKINSYAVENIAKCLKEFGGYLIHYSTDYVFDGKKEAKYLENDQTNPINIYGKSKLEGEKKIQNILTNFFIFRTSWVIGEYGKNFAKTILKLSKVKNNLNVVFDQVGVPTSTNLISKVTKNLINDLKNERPWAYGIYNIAPKGSTNWFEIAKKIISFCSQKDPSIILKSSNIKPILTKDYQAKAQRPMNSLLNTEKLQKLLQFELPNWENDLIEILNSLLKNKT